MNKHLSNNASFAGEQMALIINIGLDIILVLGGLIIM